MALRSSLSRTLAGRHLPALDGLRAIAVFTVIVYHFGITIVPGDLGVSAFFVLSGFLITWLLLKEHRATGTISLRQFYTRRSLRIFPAYYAFLAVSFMIDYARGHEWPPGLTRSAVFYVVNYYNALHGHPVTSIAHAWSLGIEEQFYLLWPLLLLVLLRGGVPRAARAVAVLIVAVVTWRCGLFLGRHVGQAYVYNAFDTRFDNLAVGCLLALGAQAPGFQGVAERLGRSALAPLASLALLVVSRTALGSTYHYTLGFTVDAVLVAVFIVQLLQLHGSPLWSWLESPPARFLGVISYPLYLWHVWGLTVGHRVPVGGSLGKFVVGVLACIVAACGSYYVIERPFLALKRRFEPRAAPPAAAARRAHAAETPV
ncbi:MAG TPA: acyltransferase [Gemmatimonadales bacterium]|nr:acyltransferase [Gemmatimonadales bacterium]